MTVIPSFGSQQVGVSLRNAKLSITDAGSSS